MRTTVSTWAAATRHDVIALVGRDERAYFAYQRRFGRGARRTLVDDATDLCVEAPPGSGNTFFVSGFAAANPAVRLAHHHHVAAQVQRASRLGVPTLLIVRDPVACVLSRAVSWRHRAAIAPTYREWISFWRHVLPLTAPTVVVDFTAITEDPAAVVERLNVRCDRRYSTEFPSRSEVFAAMDKARAHAFPSFAEGSGVNPNRPDARKDALREQLAPHVRSHRLATPARRLYEQVAKTTAVVR